MNFRSLSLLSLFGFFQMGCGLLGSGVEVRSVNSSVQKPSNVAIYVAVEDENLPVGGLEAKNFQIYEDDVPVDATHSKLTLLNRDDVAVHHAVVLIDLSGSPDEATRTSIAKGASHLVEKLRQDQGVTVLGFDGSPKLHPLGEFPRSSDTTVPEVKGISTFHSADESRNLNGAIVQGLDQLDARLMRQKKPVRVGTLVVFTRGDDLAGRVAADAVWEKLRSTPHEIYGIGIDSPDAHQLDDMARNGVKKSANVSEAPIAFENMAMLLEQAAAKFYLVQYCSPGRSGIRHVRVEVQHDGKEGQVAKGSLDLELDATGFSGGCDPEARPSFAKSLSEPGTLGREPEPEPTAEKKPSGTTSSEASEPTGADASGGEEIVAPPSSSDYE
jgi:hypothetical protein